ncbi:MAG: TolC family protein, partial [Porphyromonadaceae bacterium]|nr:TolC family protein [Porphyromonadaceae bacterium]
MGNKKIYFCCFYLSITVFGGAQTRYTLEQCKEFTRNNNNEIVNSRLQIKEAEQTKKEAFTKYFPSVSATGSAMNASTGTMKMDMMGNTLSLMKNGVLGGVTATQPVFAGGNILNGNKLAKVGLEASKYQAKLSEEESLLLTEQYYWQIVSLQEKIKTIGYMETLLQSIRKDVDASYQAGITTLNDVLKVKLKQ